MVRCLLVAAFATLLTACGNAAPGEQNSAKILPINPTIPTEILGRWKYVGEECEEGETPSVEKRKITVTFQPDSRYEMYVEGWTFVGKFKVEQFRDQSIRVQFEDTMYNFSFEDGRLANWSEGDAVYLCGRIFEREG